MVEIPENLRTAHILVVDDNEANVILLTKVLKSAGYEKITGMTDSRLVRDAYEADRHDIILLDIRMPYLDGFEVMAQLQSLAVDDYLPVLVLTAQIDDETKTRALQEGAKDFLHKPFERIEVLNRIRNMLEVRLLHKQVRDHNAVLEQRVIERTAELASTRLDVIQRLGRAAEYRDNETGLHVIRMSRYCEELALAIGMDGATATLLLNASPMHDVGKIGIPDNILLKPGKLDATEWETMKTHSVIGAELLSGSGNPMMDLAREVALTHHERWDGSGYPGNIAGEDIPISGRIAALCDVFDALLSARPYKKVWSHQDALDLIRSESGKHFDPELVDAFLGIQPEIMAIRANLLDEDHVEA
jgi:putative two-component system response regulator